MRVLLQRVTRASVTVDGIVCGKIDGGLLALVGVAKTDTAAQADQLAEKVANLRIFSDAQGKMNLSVLDMGGAVLAVSQFTLYGNCHKGRRPGFDQAAGAELARELYEYFVAALRELAVPVETGVFQAHMEVALVNDGPVTLWLDTDAARDAV